MERSAPVTCLTCNCLRRSSSPTPGCATTVAPSSSSSPTTVAPSSSPSSGANDGDCTVASINNIHHCRRRHETYWRWSALCLLIWHLLVSGPRGALAIKLLPIHWNSSNPMFRLDNTDHVHDVSIGDMVDVVCPQYPENTPSHMIEQHVVYQVTREEYESCRILHADDAVTRQVLKCSRPHQLNKLTIVFREFTPVPNGLEYVRGSDYYYISTSTGRQPGLYNRQGGGCRTGNMKMIFKVCCNNEVTSNSIPHRVDHMQHYTSTRNRLDLYHSSSQGGGIGGVHRYRGNHNEVDLYPDPHRPPVMERLQTSSSSSSSSLSHRLVIIYISSLLLLVLHHHL